MAVISKHQLRAEYAQKRAALSGVEYVEASRFVCHQFFSHIGLSSVQVLHSFLPIVSKKEPDTSLIIHRIKKDFPHIDIAIPKINFQHNRLEAVYYTNQPLQENKWGVGEPIGGVSTPVEEIDAVIVPLLAFDVEGHRVGYGKGHYDRFLLTCRKDCKKIGLSFFPPVKKIQTDYWDISLHCCITPKQVYWFNKA